MLRPRQKIGHWQPQMWQDRQDLCILVEKEQKSFGRVVSYGFFKLECVFLTDVVCLEKSRRVQDCSWVWKIRNSQCKRQEANAPRLKEETYRSHEVAVWPVWWAGKSFHQSFVNCCQRLMLLPSKYFSRAVTCWFTYSYHPPLPINFSDDLLIAYCVPDAGDLTVSKTQSLLTSVCVHACQQTIEKWDHENRKGLLWLKTSTGPGTCKAAAKKRMQHINFYR